MAKKSKPSEAATHTMVFREIPLGRIRVRAYRHLGNPPDFADLVASVKALGYIEPLVVAPVAPDGLGIYELVAGYRRWRAAVLLSTREAVVELQREFQEAAKTHGGGYVQVPKKEKSHGQLYVETFREYAEHMGNVINKRIGSRRVPCVVHMGVNEVWVTAAQRAENVIRKDYTATEVKRFTLNLGAMNLSRLHDLDYQYFAAERAAEDMRPEFRPDLAFPEARGFVTWAQQGLDKEIEAALKKGQDRTK